MGVSNPQSNYVLDYAFIEGVEDAVFTPKDPAYDGATTYTVKTLWIDPDTNPIPSGQRLGLSPVESALYFWAAGSGCPDPKPQDLLTISSIAYSVIHAEELRWGFYRLRVQTQLVNS